jgi:type VI secretion system secreted protein Hcp
MAVDIFLKLGAIKGESTDPSHSGWIDVLAWSWGESQSGTIVGGGGHVSIQDIAITKYVDKASVPMLLASAEGTHIPTATLVARRAGATPVEFLKYQLEEVIVTSVAAGGSGGEDRFTESISLNFGKITWTYTPTDGAGNPLHAVTGGWDVVNGVPL